MDVSSREKKPQRQWNNQESQSEDRKTLTVEKVSHLDAAPSWCTTELESRQNWKVDLKGVWRSKAMSSSRNKSNIGWEKSQEVLVNGVQWSKELKKDKKRSPDMDKQVGFSGFCKNKFLTELW